MSNRGFTLSELLISMALVSLMMVGMLTLLFRGQDIATRNESRAKLQNIVRFAVDRLERDLRMIGFGVPEGAQIGGSANWLPSIFYASGSAIGFRADADGSWASVICTPRTANVNCPRNEVYLDSIDYYESNNCRKPDDGSSYLPVVVVLDGGSWESATCSSVDTVDDHLIVTANLDNGTFVAGQSSVVTVEQVYYRYTPSTQPPYGLLERYVRYANSPSNTFPPTSVTWTVIADHLTDFWLEYRDASGSVLTGSPLSAANRANVDSIFMLVEAYDSVGAQGVPLTFEAESQVLLRNAD